MQPVSAAFLAEIVKSHTVHSYAVLTSPNGQMYPLTITAGTVTIDSTAEIRRSASFTCIDPEGILTPLSSRSPLAPFGSMVDIYRGVRYTSGPLAGTTETVQLGHLRVADATAADTDTGTPAINVDAYDQSRTISRNKFTQPYTIAQGTNAIQAAQAVINITFPDAQFDAISSNATTSAPLVFDVDADPWADVVQVLAQMAGCEAYFEANGNVKIAPPVDVDHLPAPVFTYIEGVNCTMLELDVEFTDDPGYNGVVVVGQAAGDSTPPVRSVQWDDNPNSPTYYLGPYGQVPYAVTNSTVTTQADADAAAIAQLNLLLGFESQLAITATVNPALDAEDVVAVQRGRSGVNSSYAIDTIQIPLDAGSTMSLALRQKRIS